MAIQLSACAILDADSRVLLLYKIKQSYFEFPGGKVEIGEIPLDAAKRETKEELGVDVESLSLHSSTPFVTNNQEYICHVYLARIVDGQTPRIMEPDAFSEMKWISKHDLDTLAVAPNVRIFLN